VTKVVPLAPLQHHDSIADRIAEPQIEIRGGVISIGNFDGVHRGHAQLLTTVRRRADEIGGPAIAVVLDPHPATILRPEFAPEKLTWIERRAERMSGLGIDYLVTCHTTHEFLQQSAETFFAALVVDQLACRGIVEGPNFFFGHDRAGDVSRLGSLCQAAGITLDIVEPTLADSQWISSTRIRRLLQSGQVEQAAQWLESYHRLRGTVIRGDQRGRQIGFPTANLGNVDVVVPAPGVYAGRARVGTRTYDSAIHIGPRPTFESPVRSNDDENASTNSLGSNVEVHLLNYTGDLYGQELLVDVIARVRDIVRFDSARQLANQLTKDVEQVRESLASARVKWR